MTARKVLSHKALNRKANKVGKHERRTTEELASKNGKLENELQAAKKTFTGLEKLCGGTKLAETLGLIRGKEKVVVVARELKIE